MLIEFLRIAENEYGEPTGETNSLAVNPEHVAAFFGRNDHADQTYIRLADGRGYGVAVPYAEVKEKLGNGVRFIELRRPVDAAPPADDTADFGEDDGIALHPAVESTEPISFNPPLVAMVHGNRDFSNRSIVKMRDGRGLNVMGTFAEVRAALDAPTN